MDGETINNKPSGPIIMIYQSDLESTVVVVVRSYLLHASLAQHRCAFAYQPQPSAQTNAGRSKTNTIPFCWAKPAHFDFSSSSEGGVGYWAPLGMLEATKKLVSYGRWMNGWMDGWMDGRKGIEWNSSILFIHWWSLSDTCIVGWVWREWVMWGFAA